MLIERLWDPLATSAVASAGPTPGIASSRLLVAFCSMPGHAASVELQYLGLQCPQLTAESSKTCAGHLGEPVVGWIGDDFQQLLDTPAPDRGDNPELGGFT